MASALLASDAGLAMNLVDRSEERARGEAPDAAVTELTRKLRRRFEAAAGRIRVSCPGETTCRASVDGDAVGATRTRWVTAGEHVVTFDAGGGAAPITRKVAVRAGEIVEVAPAGAGSGGDASAPASAEPAGAPARPRD